MSEFKCRRCGRDLDTGMICWTIGCPGDSSVTHSTIDTHGVVYSPMPDARKRAEEALAAYHEAPHERVRADRCAFALRAILAEPVATPASDEVREAAEMLRLTVGMREAKHACNDRACSNVALGALNLLAALSRPAAKGGEK